MATLETLRDGNVVLETRNNTKSIQIRIKVSKGRYKRISAGTRDLKVARETAEDLYDTMTARQRLKLPAFETDQKFKKLTEEYRRQLEADIAAGTDKAIDKTYLSILNKWIAPFFDNYQIADIDLEAIHQYEQHRKKVMGREPSKSTINQHNVVLRALFHISERRKFRPMGTFPTLTVKGKGIPIQVRPAFELNEVKPLLNFLARWHSKGTRSATRYKRQLLFCYVGVLLLSGIRPGKEMAGLKWRHIEEDFISDRDNLEAVRIWMPHRKRRSDGSKARVICEPYIRFYLRRLKFLTRQIGKYDLLFPMPDGSPATKLDEMFNNALTEAGLLLNRVGNSRTLYSLRHTYATRCILIHGTDRETLADNMGTSVGMLSKHYVHTNVEDRVGNLTGRRAQAIDATRALIEAVPEDVRKAYEANPALSSFGPKTLDEFLERSARVKARQDEKLAEIQRESES